MDFLAMLDRIGFEAVERAGETGFDSSPKTRGALVRARKPEIRLSRPDPDRLEP